MPNIGHVLERDGIMQVITDFERMLINAFDLEGGMRVFMVDPETGNLDHIGTGLSPPSGQASGQAAGTSQRTYSAPCQPQSPPTDNRHPGPPQNADQNEGYKWGEPVK